MNKRTKSRSRTRLRPETRMLVRQGIFGAGLLVLIALVLIGIWHGSRVESLTISTITVTGGETVSHDTVRNEVESILSGNYFRLIPMRFAWLYPEDAVNEAVSGIDRVRNVAIERISGTEVAIVFDEYIPYGLWCDEADILQCYFIDRAGFAFGDAPELRGESFVRYITLGTTPEVGVSILTQGDLRSIEWFIATLEEELGLYVVRIETDVVGDVSYILSGGGELKASLLESHVDTFENLKTILASEEFAHIEPGNFAYVDLRFGNKIFVNEELESAGESYATSTASSTEL